MEKGWLRPNERRGRLTAYPLRSDYEMNTIESDQT